MCIFDTLVGINSKFLQEVHMGINCHGKTPDTVVTIYMTLQLHTGTEIMSPNTSLP